MVSKGNDPQMAQQFRLVNYSNLPRWMEMTHDFPAMLAESIHIPWGAKELGTTLAHVRHVTTLSRPYWHLHWAVFAALNLPKSGRSETSSSDQTLMLHDVLWDGNLFDLFLCRLQHVTFLAFFKASLANGLIQSFVPSGGLDETMCGMIKMKLVFRLEDGPHWYCSRNLVFHL